MAASSSMNTNPDYNNKFLLAGGVKLRDPHNSQTTRLRDLTQQANFEELAQTKSHWCVDSHKCKSVFVPLLRFTQPLTIRPKKSHQCWIHHQHYRRQLAIHNTAERWMSPWCARALTQRPPHFQYEYWWKIPPIFLQLMPDTTNICSYNKTIWDACNYSFTHTLTVPIQDLKSKNIL